MKKMKKQLSMLLAVLLILTVFPCRVSAEEPDAKWIDGALLNSFGEEGGWMRDETGIICICAPWNRLRCWLSRTFCRIRNFPQGVNP